MLSTELLGAKLPFSRSLPDSFLWPLLFGSLPEERNKAVWGSPSPQSRGKVTGSRKSLVTSQSML